MLEEKKPRHITLFKDLEIKFLQPPLFTHSCLRVYFSKAAIIISKAEQIFNLSILKTVTTTFFFWLRVWLSGGLAETRLNQFEQKPLKLPRTETRITHPPKQIDRSPMWHMKDNGPGYLFCKKAFID